MKLHRVLGAVLACLLLLFVIDCMPYVYRFFSPPEFRSQLTTFDGTDTIPSATMLRLFIKAAEDRRACERAGGEHCLRQYKDAVTSAIKDHTEDVPNMGAFIPALERCPQVFDECMNAAEDAALCLDRELRCIVFVHKMNWKHMTARPQETQP